MSSVVPANPRPAAHLSLREELDRRCRAGRGPRWCDACSAAGTRAGEILARRAARRWQRATPANASSPADDRSGRTSSGDHRPHARSQPHVPFEDQGAWGLSDSRQREHRRRNRGTRSPPFAAPEYPSGRFGGASRAAPARSTRMAHCAPCPRTAPSGSPRARCSRRRPRSSTSTTGPTCRTTRTGAARSTRSRGRSTRTRSGRPAPTSRSWAPRTTRASRPGRARGSGPKAIRSAPYHWGNHGRVVDPDRGGAVRRP